MQQSNAYCLFHNGGGGGLFFFNSPEEKTTTLSNPALPFDDGGEDTLGIPWRFGPHQEFIEVGPTFLGNYRPMLLRCAARREETDCTALTAGSLSPAVRAVYEWPCVARGVRLSNAPPGPDTRAWLRYSTSRACIKSRANCGSRPKVCGNSCENIPR